MICIDIGCGRKKILGSIGIDFSSMSDADIILNLNTENLPFDDNSVDFVYSSHALEHLSLDGFFHVMSEIYRVLKPSGQFKLVVPYFTSTCNYANPFHNNNICFNEHTFRFFSSDFETAALPKYQYQTPSCPQWGLRYSSNSELNIEFKTVKINFFYFHEYRDIDEITRFRARSSKLNVVEQIAYTLTPIKPCPVRPETGPVSSSDDPHLYVEKQLAYLREQILFIENKKIKSDDLEFAKSYVFGTTRQLDIYNVNGVFTPVNFFVFELDDCIQRLRVVIDASL